MELKMQTFNNTRTVGVAAPKRNLQAEGARSKVGETVAGTPGGDIAPMSDQPEPVGPADAAVDIPEAP